MLKKNLTMYGDKLELPDIAENDLPEHIHRNAGLLANLLMNHSPKAPEEINPNVLWLDKNVPMVMELCREIFKIVAEKNYPLHTRNANILSSLRSSAA